MPERTPTEDEAHTAAVQRLFVQFQPAIRGYILAMIPDFPSADDVLQETFLVVTRKAASFEIGTSFPAWVKTIARFKCLEAIRARRNRFECLSDEVLEALGAEREGFRTDTDERLVHLAQCIDQLAPQARRSIHFRYQNDHRPPEIAGLMGCTVQSVNVTLSRARAFLRDCVKAKISATPT
ncbi:sigma-70 family RNA polymerase sigma factor [Luteolibacter marinus]|uniref:sigma-70 family RNA polymerase sigma factor n=1 Tax=Luteolibacter marinus TaxID=2776705 RepID=UPI0018678A25|nr:sigma-70 family RNA polymerase sigma factor [Luteolibacter marinus]